MDAKGSAVLSIPLFIRKTFGEEGHEKWLAALSPEAQKVFKGPVLASAWYPLRSMLSEPTRAVCDVFYDGDILGAHNSGRFSAEHGLRGIYKIFVRLGTPEGLITRASKIMPSYYRPSVMSVNESGPKHVVLAVTEFPEADDVVEARVRGWMERALEISGCRDLSIETKMSLVRGDARTEFHISWA